MKQITPFNLHLAGINKGSLNDELTEKLAGLVQAVRETGKRGTLTLTLDLAPVSGGDSILKITPKISVKTPELDRASTMMWSTGDGDLLKNSPEVEGVAFTEVVAEDAPVRDLTRAQA